jgi:hypothetical protein
MKKIALLIVVSSFFLQSCSNELVEVEKTIELKKANLNAEDTIAALGFRIQGAGHSGDFAYRTDSVNQYSAAFAENLQDSLVGSKIRVCVNFWAKSTNPLKGDCLGVTFCKKDGSCAWNGFDIINYTAKSNEWVNIIDSLTYSADQFAEAGSLIKVFAFNPNKTTIVDFDDINIVIKKVYIVAE